jgi:hypothetical protein
MNTVIAHRDQNAEGRPYPGYVTVEMSVLVEWLRIQRQKDHDPMIEKAGLRWHE